jgi:S-formylglutathione hydrolase FrmB
MTPLLACLLALAACGPTSQRLAYRTLDSRALGKPMDFAVLAAPLSTTPDTGPLPVVYLLHGLGDDHRSLDRFGLSDRLHAAMIEGRVPRAHIVAPNGERGFYINWHDGTHDYEDYLVAEVLPAAERELGLEVDRNDRHIIGVSMGGLGALQVGLRHPDLFASMASLSGLIPDVDEAADLVRTSPANRRVDLRRVFGDCSDRAFVDAHNPYQIVRRRGAALGQRVFLAVGDRERAEFQRTAASFHELLAAIGAPHEYVVYEGGHGWRAWAPVVERALRYALQP